MRAAVIYSRVSDTKGRQSTERQLVDLARHTGRNDYQVLRIFSENVSGMTRNKNWAILEECIIFCIENQVDLLMVTEVSRLGRIHWRY